jgi:LacI family transcriptional regulator
MGNTVAKKRASIHDVAKLAGVSIATVSRVVNGRDRVAAGTAQAVKKAIRQLRYRPNMRARALSLRRSDTLGLVLPGFYGDIFGRLMRGVDTQTRHAGLHLVITRAHTTSGKLAEAERLTSDQVVDGVIVMVDQHGDEGLERLESLSAPVVVLDRDVGHLHLDNVLVDNASGGHDAAEHLIAAHGLSDLLFLGGPEKNVDTIERARGFGDALRAAGIDREPQMFFAANYRYDSGYGMARTVLLPQLRKAGRRGIVAANDDLARGVVDALDEEGMRVPEDVALVAFDDTSLARFGRPTLTSVRAPLEEVGIAAVKMILDRLADPKSQPVKSILKGRLIPRASCGCEG